MTKAPAIGAILKVKHCALDSIEYQWGFREGERVEVMDPAIVRRPADVGADDIAVVSVERGMIGMFHPDNLSA
jgi:hypothetical protein